MPRFLASVAASLACVALLLAPITSASQQQDSNQNHATTGPAATGFHLGDLLEFRLIAAQALLLVKTDDLPAAKEQITALRSAWHDAEEEIRPRSPANWRAIDKAIGRVIEALYAKAPYAPVSIAALDRLIATLDSSQPR